MTALEELRNLALRWQEEVNTLNGERENDKGVAWRIVGSTGAISEELESNIFNSNSYVYSLAYEIFDLAANLEWENFPTDALHEQWSRIRELIQELNKATEKT